MRRVARDRAQRVDTSLQGAPAVAPHGLHNVLLAVDGSEYSAKAVQQVIGMRQDLRQPESMTVHLLNVQRPVSGDVSRFVPGDTLKEYHQEGSEQALAPARALLDAAGVQYHEHRRVGEPALSIAEVAHELGNDLVVMGTRGLGGVAAGLIGSVAQATVAQCRVPVLLVR